MTKTKTTFICTECGSDSLRWEGRCPGCGAWNALVEAPARGARRPATVGAMAAPPRLLEPAGDEGARMAVRLGEFDRVLGGGLVPASVVLLGGAPGVGKSTFLLQVAARLETLGRRVLYVSGEESHEQVGMRASRVGGGSTAVHYYSSTDVEDVLRAAEEFRPDVLCVDSVQTLSRAALGSAAGGVVQVRECASLLKEHAKEAGITTFLVGHVTKGGMLAGPRTLEHLVDVVLHFEGQRSTEYRILRSSKNRFGSVDEVAAFRMTDAGLLPVPDPSVLFLTDRPEHTSGSAVAVPLRGARPLLAEVQALTLPSRFASPQRIATGVLPRRLAILLAILERRVGVALGGADVFVSVVGGLRLVDPAADLAVVAALISAARDRPLPEATAFVGEVGLGGELRNVPRGEARVGAARNGGMRRIVLPAGMQSALGSVPGALWVSDVAGVVEWMEGV